MVNGIYYARWDLLNQIFFDDASGNCRDIGDYLECGENVKNDQFTQMFQLLNKCLHQITPLPPPPPPPQNHEELCRDYCCTPKGFCLVGLGKNSPPCFIGSVTIGTITMSLCFVVYGVTQGCPNPWPKGLGRDSPGHCLTHKTLGPSTWCKIKMGPKSPSVNTQCTKHPSWMLHHLVYRNVFEHFLPSFSS